MAIEMINETAYLTAQNYQIYRLIMRVFYLESNKYNYHLYMDDVIEKLDDYDDLDFDEDGIKNALDALVKWGNLIAVQDVRQVNTIEEFKARKFRYSITDVAVEIERMTVKLENLVVKRNASTIGYLKRLYQEFARIDTVLDHDETHILEWWDFICGDFHALNMDYSDYLRDFYSDRTQKLMQSLEFLKYKEYFLKMLRDFVGQLQKYAIEFEIVFSKLDDSYVDALLERIVTLQKNNPSSLNEIASSLEQDIANDVQGKFQELKKWFVSAANRQREVDVIMDRTNHIIHKIIQNAGMIVDYHEGIISKKDDYRHYLKLFSEISEINQAHCYGAHIFGIHNLYHLMAYEDKQSESISLSSFEQQQQIIEIKPTTRKYRIKKTRCLIADRQMEKEIQKLKRQEEIDHQFKIAAKFIKSKRIDFKEIDEVLTPDIRMLLLSWVASANGTSDKVGVTEYGKRFKLTGKDERITLRCTDGDLTMPWMILEFED